MAYPVLLALGAAAAAAGTGMQMAAASEDRAAMAAAQQAELARQKGYQSEADATFKKSLKESAPESAAGQLDKAAADRAAHYQEIESSTIGTPLPTRPSGNTVVGQPGTNGGSATARASADAARTASAWSDLGNAAQSRLGSYGDWGLTQSIKNARANQDLAITSNLARGSAEVLPYEMQAAQHKGDALASWGSLVSALGSVAGMAGVTTPVTAAEAAAGTAAGAGALFGQPITAPSVNPWTRIAGPYS